MESMEFSCEEKKLPRRDFLEATEGLDSIEREKTMREGDFIKMTVKEFKKWVSLIPINEEALDDLAEEGEIEVKIADISDVKSDSTSKISVVGGGIQKKIFASLFFNYGRPPIDTNEKSFMSNNPDGFNYNPNSGGRL